MGLTALGLVALTPTESKADDGFRVYVRPGYEQFRPYYYGDDRCMKSLLSVLALAFGVLTFQSCEVYPDQTSRGYYHGGYYGGDHYGDGHYGGGGVVVSSDTASTITDTVIATGITAVKTPTSTEPPTSTET